MFNSYSSMNYIGAFTFLSKVEFLDSMLQCWHLRDGKREQSAAIAIDAANPSWRVMEGGMAWERI